MKLFDLSNAQKMLLFSNIENPNNTSFNLNFKREYNIDDIDYLKKAVNFIANNYLNLQIKNIENGEFKQYYVNNDDNFDRFEYFKLTKDDDLEEIINDFLDKPFNPFFDTPLYRLAIIENGDSLMLIGSIHHTIADGTSVFTILPREIDKIIYSLKNKTDYEKINNISYEIYVNREKEYLKSNEALDDKKYWLDILKDYNQDWYSFKDTDMGTYELKLNKSLVKTLEKLSDIDGTHISPFVLGLSILFFYLSKSKSNNENLVLETSISGRYFGQDIKDNIGMFVNLLPLKFSYDENMSFEDLLLYCKSVLKEGLSHGKIQFNEYSQDLRYEGINPELLSMYSIVSNSTPFKIEFLEDMLKNTTFPFHVRLNKNYNDEDGLQSFLFIYNKNCFSKKQIMEIAKGIEDLINEISYDSSKSLKDYNVKINEFFEAETYFKNLINSFDNPTVLSPDIITTNDSTERITKTKIFKESTFKSIKEHVTNNKLTIKELITPVFLFNLTKFAFSKDILISSIYSRNINNNHYLNNFNEIAIGYKFDTSISINSFINDFKLKLNELEKNAFYPLKNNQDIDFESEILYNYVNMEDLDSETIKNFNKIDINNFNTFKFIFTIYESKEGLAIYIDYDNSYYSEDFTSSFLKSFNTLLTKFINHPNDLLENTSMLEDEINLDDFKIDLMNNGLINKIFEQKVDENPDKIILQAIDGDFTYSQLNDKANRIANWLINQGVEIEDRIMIMMDRTSDLIAAVLGVVKAGCAFIPVDPKYPEGRINQILEDSNSKFVIVNDGINYDGENKVNINNLLSCEDISNPNPNLKPDNLCFIIYTSGSTGKPKGVMITHKGISNYIANEPLNVPIYALNHDCSKMISISTVSFIVFLREIFGTILNGLPVVFADEEQAINPLALAELFNKTNADAFGSTPTRLLEYLKFKEIQNALNKCKVIIIGGEGFPPRLYDELSKYTDAKIYNSYGPTEVTIASHGKLIDSNKVSAGWSMLNVVDKIMDVDGNEVLPYVTGEIYVGGAGIARGYLNNIEKTNEVFFEIEDVPFYNTGDLGVKDENGELFVLGRNDSQIKLRGLRIELSEIEEAISEYEGIASVVVIVKKLNSVEYLCAYYTTFDDVNVDGLREFVSNLLPEYMVPSYFIELDKFPTTPNGKTAFNELPDPEIKVEEKIIPPRNKTEEEILNIVKEVLNLNEVSVTTDLFKLGLTSLSVMQLVSKISNTLGIAINLTNIMKSKNIRGISEDIDKVKINKLNREEELELYPLTANQLGVYFDCVKDPMALTYNLPKFIDFGNDIDASRLKESILKTIEYHPYLKTRIIMKEGTVYQERRVEPYNEDLIEIVDLGDSNKSLSEYKDIVQGFINPFELDKDYLFRFKILKDGDRIILFADFHHIILDGTSLNILFNEIASIYDSKNLELDKSKLEEVDGFEYSVNEKSIENSNLYKEAELYYLDKVKEIDEASLITPDLKGEEAEGELSIESILINKDKVVDFTNELSISPNILFLSLTNMVLSKFTYSKDLLFACASNGRFDVNYEKTLAMMVKTLPFVLKLNTNLTIKDYLDYIKSQWFDVLSYSSYPLTEFSNSYDITPEFLYAFHGKIIEDININGKTIARENLDYEGLKFKISLNIIEVNGEYELKCDYNDALYSREFIKTFLDSISILLDKFITLSSDTLVKNLSIVNRPLLSPDNIVYGKLDEVTIDKIYEKQVDLHSDDLVLNADDGDFTFNELNIKANKIANSLIKKGVTVEDKIMFILNRNSNVFASMIGISKSGGAFIPIDPDYPKERIEHVLSDSDSKFIIVDDIINKHNVDLSEYNNQILDINELLEEEDESNPNVDIKGDNLAYVIYTSGSTGLPKGVMIEHENIANFVYPSPKSYYQHEIATNYKKENYKSLSISTVAFDMFLYESLTSICNGVPVAFANNEQYKDPIALIDLLKNTGANIYLGTPSRLLEYLDIKGLSELFLDFKMLLIGGEAFAQPLREFLEENYNGTVINIYGPTETTIVTNMHNIDDGTLSIGKPIYNTYEEIMDLDSNPLPANVTGELFIAGKGVSRSYINRPKKTKEVYVTINGVRYYRTGDFAKYDENGNVFIYGRLDNQIKLRGLRIEIGEVESAISSYEPIKNVIVVVRNIKGNDHLCAYFTVSDDYKKNLDENEFSIDIDDLKEKLSQRLTYYMVPTVYMELDELPQTLNGKIDQKNLPAPVLISEYVAPTNDVEAFFANTFANILTLDKVGATDNFFEIGGTSLLVTKITMAALARNYELNYGVVFENPTPRKLANFVLSNDSLKEFDEEEDYDYTSINKLLKKNNLKTFMNGEMEESLGNILLTGATGFLGIHVLKELIDNETGNIYCLVRSKGNLTSEDRLKLLLFYYFANNYENLMNKRIHVIDGDITDFKDFEKLISYDINTLINCAANVKHFSSGTDIEDINYGGVINGLKFAKYKQCKYVQVSTYSVSGKSVNNFPPLDTKFNETDLYIGQKINNKYVNSKFLAERAILESAITDDLNVKIFRVGNLMARSSDSEFQINFDTNAFLNTFKAYTAIGKVPYSSLTDIVEFSPIDMTAKSIVTLAKAPKDCTVFHGYNNHTVYLGDILNIIKPLGINITPVAKKQYEDALNEILNDENRRDSVSGFITSGASHDGSRVSVPVDNSYTIKILYSLGLKWPLISDSYIYNFIRYLHEMDFFDV